MLGGRPVFGGCPVIGGCPVLGGYLVFEGCPNSKVSRVDDGQQDPRDLGVTIII